MPTTRERRLLTNQEVRDMLSLSRHAVYRLAEKGRLKRVRFGHSTHRYTMDSVERLVASAGD